MRLTRRTFSPSFVRGLAFGGLALGSLALVGCGDPCLDDGLGKRGSECKAGNEEIGDTETDTDTDTDDAETAEASTTAETTETEGEGDTYCADEDMDGFGDPNNCETVPMGDPQPPGTVPEDDATDCDDQNANTFPRRSRERQPRGLHAGRGHGRVRRRHPEQPRRRERLGLRRWQRRHLPRLGRDRGAGRLHADEDGDGYGEHDAARRVSSRARTATTPTRPSSCA
ncbi:MAG: hypothetical protein HC927_05125, partial [Deltaproteobacteria bacterium]|nr:hypothetical protein [Deltaproteobacteria bacterium]